VNLSTLKQVYFLGIGGIGMSAIARWFISNGYEVSGYDRTPTPLTDALQAEGIAIHFDDDIARISPKVLASQTETLVVYTPAIPKTHSEFNYLIDNGFVLMKRSQVLGFLTKNMFTIAVAGTHGKTTTSSMVAHVLKHANRNVTAFLGGITQNYGTNFLCNNGPDNLICVVEADEFDRSFLTLFPDVTIVTSTDADHLDIYGDHSHLLESFELFIAQIKDGGQFFMQSSLGLSGKTKAQTNTFGLKSGDYHAQNLRIGNGRFEFDAHTPSGIIADIALRMPGFHNVENALACVAACMRAGLSHDEIRAGLNAYRGVKRRFEYQLETEEVIYIDDYAHHPTEIEAFLSSVKALYPDRPLTCIFQPHLFSRTRDFQEGFAQSLDLADEIILLDIYPARELPIAGVTSAIIFDKLQKTNKIQLHKNEVIEHLSQHKRSLVVTVGAGDIDTLVVPIKEFLQK
jgi:UDP-N-acetylmuramate--alanine ligase